MCSVDMPITIARPTNGQGAFLQRGYRSFVIDRDEYLLECGRYIERNPIKAGLLPEPGAYAYSSFSYYADGARGEFLSKSPARYCQMLWPEVLSSYPSGVVSSCLL